MKLNTIKPATGAKNRSKRVGRGIGSTLGKTCGRGHKGQKSRSGGFSKVGFEGGQMPIQRRLPKVGFSSRIGRVSAQVRLSDLAKIEGEIVDLNALKAAGIIKSSTVQAKIFASGSVEKNFTIKNIAVSKGAKEAILAAGGTIEE